VIAKTSTARADLFVLKPEWQARREKTPNDEHVAAMRGSLQDGHELPPVSVVKLEDGGLALVDGYHRFEAMCREGRDRIPFVIVASGSESIEWQLARANAGNGWHRTREEKRDAVKRALEAPEGADTDNVGIARWCCVSVDLVRDVRDAVRGAPSAAAERKQILRGDRPEAEAQARVPKTTRHRSQTQEPTFGTEETSSVPNVGNHDSDESLPFETVEPAPQSGTWEEAAAAHVEVMRAISQLKRDHAAALALCNGSQEIVGLLDRARGIAKVRTPQACPAPHDDGDCYFCAGKGFVIGDPGNWEAQLAARKRVANG
jgi:hypothetical protein